MNKKNNEDVCNSKIKHDSEKHVIWYIFETKTQSILDYYLCDVCNKYHTKSISTKENKKYMDKKIKNERKLDNIIRKKKRTRPRRKS